MKDYGNVQFVVAALRAPSPIELTVPEFTLDDTQSLAFNEIPSEPGHAATPIRFRFGDFTRCTGQLPL